MSFFVLLGISGGIFFHTVLFYQDYISFLRKRAKLQSPKLNEKFAP